MVSPAQGSPAGQLWESGSRDVSEASSESDHRQTWGQNGALEQDPLSEAHVQLQQKQLRPASAGQRSLASRTEKHIHMQDPYNYE